MRNRWREDSEYIVNLTKQLIGENALKTIIRENKGVFPSVTRSYVFAVIANKVKKMNDATLGRICAYASSEGVHCGKHLRSASCPKFINRTGINHIFGTDAIYVFSHLGSGEYLEQIAMAVITCTVVDIIHQAEWQSEWDSWEMIESDEKVFRNQQKYM